ncbi:MAG TPA: hypothetical protein VKU77_19495 [Streptosporangiaceae bacterium]|nr:hypothetical protein [Streptosporangiaceae bacterium]
MTPPFVYDDENGIRLSIARSGDSAVISLHETRDSWNVMGERTGSRACVVLPEHRREVAAALWTVTAEPAPVILERAMPNTAGTHGVDAFKVWLNRDRRSVNLSLGNSSAALKPAVARHLAAVLAAYADAAEAMDEPDPADVEALTEAISAGMAHCGGGPEGVYRVAATVALRWMKRRESSCG